MEKEDIADRPTGCGFLAACTALFVRIRKIIKNRNIRQRRRNIRIAKQESEDHQQQPPKEASQDLGQTAGEGRCRATAPQPRKRGWISSGQEARPSFKRRRAGLNGAKPRQKGPEPAKHGGK